MKVIANEASLAPPPRSVGARSVRRAAIDHYDILESEHEVAFDNIAMLAARFCNTEAAAISFLDDDRQWFKATWGFSLQETPIAVSFCAHVIETEAVFVVRDARRDPRFCDNPLVTGEPHIGFYAGTRIVAADGTPIASLCVIDPAPRLTSLSSDEQDALRALAAQVRSLLELRRCVIERQEQLAMQSALAQRLLHVAEHDELTGLPMRALFHKRLESAMHNARRDGTRVALMLVDVDHFKQINDSLGHDVGDALLCSFARRLPAVLRASDTVARLGGDEFGVVLPGIQRDEEIAAIMRSLCARLQEPIRHEGRMVECRASIGLAIYPDHAMTAAELTKCSDLALATAKLSRGCAITYSPSMAEEFERETRMLAIAREAVAENRIIAFYQPKLDLGSGTLVGFEALVRCAQVGAAPILPEMFAPAFVDRQLAAAISEQMLAQVLGDMRGWIDAGLAFGHVAINTCAADFHADDFAERLLAELDAHGLPPGLIEVEVTEGVFLGRGAHYVARALRKLSENGIRVALDDFGTGFASLTQLKQFPVDVLKIDRSFVGGIGCNPDDMAIVRALIGLGNSLGIETVAEGIETTTQAEFVKAHGCAVGQGFLFSPAEAASQVPAMVARFTQGARERPTA